MAGVRLAASTSHGRHSAGTRWASECIYIQTQWTSNALGAEIGFIPSTACTPLTGGHHLMHRNHSAQNQVMARRASCGSHSHALLSRVRCSRKTDKPSSQKKNGRSFFNVHHCLFIACARQCCMRPAMKNASHAFLLQNSLIIYFFHSYAAKPHDNDSNGCTAHTNLAATPQFFTLQNFDFALQKIKVIRCFCEPKAHFLLRKINANN